MICPKENFFNFFIIMKSNLLSDSEKTSMKEKLRKHVLGCSECQKNYRAGIKSEADDKARLLVGRAGEKLKDIMWMKEDASLLAVYCSYEDYLLRSLPW